MNNLEKKTNSMVLFFAPMKVHRFIRPFRVFYQNISQNMSVGLLNSTIKEPKDLIVLSENSIISCNKLRESIVSKNLENSKAYLIAFDGISNELCRCLDMCEFIRNAHEMSDFRSFADEAFTKLSGYMQELNSDVELYECLSAIVTDHAGNLTYEELNFAKALKDEFENDGIHLFRDKSMRSAVSGIQAYLNQLESIYLSGVHSRLPSVTVGPIENSNDHFVLSKMPNTRLINAKEIEFQNPPADLLHSLLGLSGDSIVREQLWRAVTHGSSDCIPAFVGLLEGRHQYAQILGYKSPLEKSLKNKLLNNENEVKSFLTSYANSSKSEALKDLETLQKFAHDSKLELALNRGNAIQAWDLPFLIRQYKYNRPGAVDYLSELSEYFSLQSCLNGLRMVCQELLNIKLVNTPINEMEGWTGNPKELIKFSVYVDDEYYGILYFDLLARENKFKSCAHFNILSGCQNHSKFLLDRFKGVKNNNLEWQFPVVVVACSFQCSEDGQLNLTYSELITLYHEFGHALHSLLSKTKFQHLSGTRGPMDFAEIPSHVFEQFAQCPSLIHKWARKSHNGVVTAPTMDLISESIRQYQSLRSLTHQTQILYSAADQCLHGEELSNYFSVTTESDDVHAKYYHILNEICIQQRQYTVIPVASGASALPNMALLSYTHLVNYSGSYYVYLYSQLWAQRIWEVLFKIDPLNKKAGSVWKNVLYSGSAGDVSRTLEGLVAAK